VIIDLCVHLHQRCYLHASLIFLTTCKDIWRQQ